MSRDFGQQRAGTCTTQGRVTRCVPVARAGATPSQCRGPRVLWHGHLVLVAAGLLAVTEPRRGGTCSGRVPVPVAPLALAALGRRVGEAG